MNQRKTLSLSGAALLSMLLIVLSAMGCKTVETARQAVTDVTARLVQSESYEAGLSDEELVVRYRAGAEQGKADACYRLGELYKEGRGVPQDDAEAVKLFRLAADQGHAGAQVALGRMYESGRGMAKNDNEALKWYRKAADQRYAEGQCLVGVMYFYGRGVAQSDAEALKWFRRAADQGSPWGQNLTGFMYENGRGVSQDYQEAVKWYRRAAEQGYAVGQDNLGNMYYHGRGVAEDNDEALKWFRLAADQGNRSGQARVGLMHLHGFGVAQNDAEALKWYRLAAEQNYEWAVKQVEEHFNYDALDDDSPATYEDHLKAHYSLELYSHGSHRGVVASDNGKRMVAFFKTKGSEKDFTGASVWEYDSRMNTFAKHPFRFLRKANDPFPAALSRDGSLMVYSDSIHNAIVLVDLDRNRTLRTIKEDAAIECMAISRDNETLAVQESRKFGKENYLTIYSVKQGTRLARTGLPAESRTKRLAFDGDGNLVVSYNTSSYSEEREPGDRYRFTDTTELFSNQLQSIRRFSEYTLSGMFPDGFRLILTHGDREKDIYETKVFDIRSRQWQRVEMPFTYQVLFGPSGRFLADRTEYLLRDDRAIELQSADIDFRKRPIVLYGAEAGSWFMFYEDRILAMKIASETLERAMVALEEGRELVKIGFHEPGVVKVREAITIYPAADRLNDRGFYAGLAGENVPLRHIGALLLTQYETILQDKAIEQGQAITIAVERLRDYGMFASAAGHPDLALQAAQRIRFLQERYPDAAFWDRLLKNAMILEALNIAAVQSPDRAYDYILGQGGLIHEDYIDVARSITNWKAKSFWLPLYSDTTKLAYLLKRDASKLETPEDLSIPRQPYPDLSGRFMEPRAHGTTQGGR